MPRKASRKPTPWSIWALGARTATELSQTDFGERIGKTKGAITDWERAENMPDLASVVRILEVFGDRIPPPPIPGYTRAPAGAERPARPLPPEAADVAEYIAAVPKKHRPAVRDAVSRYIPVVLAGLSAKETK